jgi:aromatase
MKHTQSNSIVCNATQAEVYAVICDSQQWPDLFEPCLAVEAVQRDANGEHIRVTANVGGTPMTWESKRVFRREIFGIDTRVSKPMTLVKDMATTWRVIAMNDAQSLLVLEHDYTLLEDVAGLVDGVSTKAQAESFIAGAIHKNSTKELGNIRDAVQGSAAAVDGIRSTSHSICCEVPAAEVYAIIADASNWPKIFDSCVSAQAELRHGNTELVHIEANQAGKVISWDTLRTYHDSIFRIDFHLPVPMPFLKEMSGQWRVVPLGENRCVLNVTRRFVLLDDVSGIREDVTTREQASAVVNRFIDENAGAEMLAVKSFVERKDACFSSFSARYTLPYSPEQVFGVLSNVRQWPDVLPHCDSVKVIYDDAVNQEFVMEIATAHGKEHFRSIRRCDREALAISYFQPVPPALLNTHSGRWVVRAAGAGTELISEHSVHLNSERCAAQFDDQDVRRNKQRVRELIMKNSKATADACATWLGKELAA